MIAMATFNPLPYAERLQRRDVDDIALVVIHCTELPDLATARTYGEQIHYAASNTGNSGHIYIDRDGSVQQWVPLERIAHHVRDRNANSIGIELVNTGRYPNWLDSRHQAMNEAYPAVQIQALMSVLDNLRTQLPNLHQIAGHEDLDTTEVAASDNPHISVRRKRDPGEQFPWVHVLAHCPLQRVYE